MLRQVWETPYLEIQRKEVSSFYEKLDDLLKGSALTLDLLEESVRFCFYTKMFQGQKKIKSEKTMNAEIFGVPEAKTNYLSGRQDTLRRSLRGWGNLEWLLQSQNLGWEKGSFVKTARYIGARTGAVLTTWIRSLAVLYEEIRIPAGMWVCVCVCVGGSGVCSYALA